MKTGKERYLAYHREKELCDVGRADGIKFLPQGFNPNSLAGASRPSPTGLPPPVNHGILSSSRDSE